MKQRLELLQEESRKSLLDESERQSIRNSLLEYIERNPVREPAAPVVSPWHTVGKTNLALLILLILIIGFGSISYAAEGAVPGDALYPLKRNVNEKVQSFFAFSDASKAELDVKLASERFTEAEQLQARSRLNGQAQLQLSEDVSAQISSFKNHVTTLSASHDDNDAAQVTSELQSSVAAHAAIVPKLVGTLNDSTNVMGLVIATSSASTSVQNSNTASINASSTKINVQSVSHLPINIQTSANTAVHSSLR